MFGLEKWFYFDTVRGGCLISMYHYKTSYADNFIKLRIIFLNFDRAVSTLIQFGVSAA